MGNKTSAAESPERAHEIHVIGSERIQQPDVIIEQLRQQILCFEGPNGRNRECLGFETARDCGLHVITRKAEDDNLILNQTLKTQGIIIQSLRQKILQGAHGTVRLTGKCTRETQTDQDDVYFGNHHAPLFARPRISCHRAEYHHYVTDKWLHSSIQRAVHAEPLGRPPTAAIKVFNASVLTWNLKSKSVFNTRIKPILPQLEAGEKIYYHGSSDGYIKSIIENGIDVSKSSRATDFSSGGGFYVTKNFGKAVEWSKRRAVWDKGRPAVLAFKISRSLRKEEPHLALKVDCHTNRKWWECVVSHFRNSEMSPDVHKALAGVKFIKGPVANNKYVGFDENPRPFDFTQLCIRDEEYARRFGSLQNIAFVIFGVNK